MEHLLSGAHGFGCTLFIITAGPAPDPASLTKLPRHKDSWKTCDNETKGSKNPKPHYKVRQWRIQTEQLCWEKQNCLPEQPILPSWVGRSVFHHPQPLHLSTSSTPLLLPSSCPVRNKQHVGIIPCDQSQADQSHQRFHHCFPAPAWWHISPCWLSPALVNVPGPQRTWAGMGLAASAVQRAELSKMHDSVFPNSPSGAAQEGHDTITFLFLVCREHFAFSWQFIYLYLFILLLVAADSWAVLHPLRCLKHEVAAVGVSHG